MAFLTGMQTGALILICFVLGFIYLMMSKPELFQRIFNR